MRTTAWLSIAALVGSSVLAGCERAKENAGTADTAAAARGAADDYPIVGRVVSVAPDRKAVTLDHEDIPDLMQGMQMQFAVEGPQILEGIDAGDEVEGRLKVADGNYVITELKKR